jgi:beta-mannanase
MIPTNAQGVPQGTLVAGATGSYNGYFVSLAQALVAAGEGNSYLRLGWEFDGNWYPWQASTPTAEASYAQYFQQIVTAMRSVAGEAFQFVWNPDGTAFTSSDYSVAAAYPGNAYVNLIGIDLYDMSWGNPLTPSNVWNRVTLPALTAADNFAKAHGKPVAVCEWGVQTRDGHGLGDDPLYVNNMAGWMDIPDHDVAYESYFDGITQTGVEDQYQIETDGLFPNSRAAFSADFGRLK